MRYIVNNVTGAFLNAAFCQRVTRKSAIFRFVTRDPNPGDFPSSMRTSNVQKRRVEKRPTSKKAERLQKLT